MKCPKCGDELTPATKVCPRCGCITDNQMDERFAELDEQLTELRALPDVSFGTYFSAQAYLLYAIVLLILLAVWLMTGGGLFMILSALALVLFIISLIRKLTGYRRGRDAEEAYRLSRSVLESTMRTLKNDYGESKEARDRLKSCADGLKEVIWRHDANRRRAVKVWIATLAVTAVIGVAGIVLLGSRDLETAQEPETEEMEIMTEEE